MVNLFASDPGRNSWEAQVHNAYRDTEANGRGGLGTIWVWSGANDRLKGGNTNDQDQTNARFGITVAATGMDGNTMFFSNPGASVLVSAQGENIIGDNASGIRLLAGEFRRRGIEVPAAAAAIAPASVAPAANAKGRGGMGD